MYDIGLQLLGVRDDSHVQHYTDSRHNPQSREGADVSRTAGFGVPRDLGTEQPVWRLVCATIAFITERVQTTVKKLVVAADK